LKKISLCLFFFPVITYSLRGQTPENKNQGKWLMSLGPIVNKENVIERSFSSIPFCGINFGVFCSSKYQKSKVSYELEGYYSKGILETKVYPFTDLRFTYLNIDFINLYKINSNPASITYKAGGSVDILYQSRDYNNFINNKFSFDFAASLSSVFEVSYAFRNMLPGFVISDRIIVPVISSVEQPSFGREEPSGYSQDGSTIKNFLGSNRIMSFSSFVRVKNFVSLEKSMTNRQKLTLSYLWDYYQLSGSRDVKQANHRLGLIYSYTF